MITNKRGMQVAISTVVGLVLGGMMLMAGIALLATIVSNTEEIHDRAIERIEDEIKEAFTGGQPIYIHNNPVEPVDDLAIFGVGIYNIHSEAKEFQISIEDSYDLDENIAFLEPGEIGPRNRHITTILIPTKELERGQNSFTMKIEMKNEDDDYVLYDTRKILYVNK